MVVCVVGEGGEEKEEELKSHKETLGVDGSILLLLVIVSWT